MDISDTLAPKSDQLDAVDLLGSPQTFTVTKVSKGNAEQPVNVHLAEFPRVWRPGKSMRRVLAHCWGTDAAQWTGRRVTLYCDESVTFGNDVVGGTRISHLSHIEKTVHAPILLGQGRPGTWKVEPLPDAPAAPTPEPLTDAMIACATDVDQLGNWWRQYPEQRPAIETRVAEIKASEAQKTATEDQP